MNKILIDKEKLVELYIKKQLSTRDIAKRLKIHHIKNYRKFENKEKANNLNNLVCLCNRCHSFIHSNSNENKLFIEE